jgi:hypothetical protein
MRIYSAASCSSSLLVSDARKCVVDCAVARSANAGADSSLTCPCLLATVHIYTELGGPKKVVQKAKINIYLHADGVKCVGNIGSLLRRDIQSAGTDVTLMSRFHALDTRCWWGHVVQLQFG